ncbi:MAG: Grx4 family monothiol glutaredoxin [Myxococcota bacterium]|nr:Grx4 family monothiol glutaredoxin [Myxococcota bacterium]
MGLIRKIGRKVIDMAVGPTEQAPAASPRDVAQEPPPQRERPPEPESPRGEVDPTEYIEAVVGEHPVTIFMKGTPSSPQCGFSANAAGILAAYDAVPHAVDVLLDPDVREAIKEYSGWPTIPQIYIGGEFVGGSDILAQLHSDGDLEALVSAAVTS